MNKPRINPILKRDMLVSSRSSKITITITIINSLFAVIAAWLLLSNGSLQNQEYYSRIVKLFPVLAACEAAVVSLIMPVLTSTSVSGERERQTLDIMLTTPVKPITIVVGKLESAIVTTFIYVIASLPFLSIAFIFGGMSWTSLLMYIGVILFIDIYIGSIGMFYSCVKRTSVTATISTVATVVCVAGITFAAGLWLRSSAEMYYGDETVKTAARYMNGMVTCMVINPVVWIADVFTEMVYDEHIVNISVTYGRYYEFVSSHFKLLAVCINMAVSVVMQLLAAFRLTAGDRKKKKK